MCKQLFFKEKRANCEYFQNTILLKEGPYMYIFLQSILRMTAWPMTPPAPYSAFHILLTVFGAGFAVFFARLFGKKIRSMASPEPYFHHVLFSCGVLLALMELYKQAFLYVIEFQGHFDWWYFPFQLCSLPMYLCLLLPFVPHKYQRIFCTFMYNYNLLGAVMVFVDPSGLMHPYWTLTLHGFIWHILLIFIGLLIAFSRMVLPTAKGFWQSTAVFAVGCVIATIINVTSHPYGNADMFYITPYYATTQIVYSQIAAKFGIFAGNAVYVLSIILGAWLLHLVFQAERP